jgi:transcriptional regulator with XRE-family HTH domain
MIQAEKIRLILLEELTNAQLKNPAYSMRAFSKRIGVSQAAISQILAGKRPLTAKTAQKILAGLDKNPREIAALFHSAAENRPVFKSIDMDTYHLISDWYHYAILSLAETDGFKSSPQWIAECLGISYKTAVDAVELLLRLDLLQRDPKTKKLSVTGEQLSAVSPVANSAMKKAVREDIDLAQKALEDTEFEERDFTAHTFCFDKSRMKEAIKMLEDFRWQFGNAMESKKKKDVYRLNLQLFPLTKKGSKK